MKTAKNYKQFICVPIGSPTIEQALKEIAYASKYAAMVELRLDRISEARNIAAVKVLAAAAKKRGLKVMCTLRPKREGGLFGGSEKERLRTLLECVGFSDYIDVELSSGKKAVGEISRKA